MISSIIACFRNAWGLHKGRGACLNCCNRWSWKKRHISCEIDSVIEVGPLCEDCFKLFTPQERLRFYGAFLCLLDKREWIESVDKLVLAEEPAGPVPLDKILAEISDKLTLIAAQQQK